jgi:hypothetical protein
VYRLTLSNIRKSLTVIAKSMWEGISEIFGFCIGSDFNSVGQLWLSREKYIVENIFTSVAL